MNMSKQELMNRLKKQTATVPENRVTLDQWSGEIYVVCIEFGHKKSIVKLGKHDWEVFHPEYAKKELEEFVEYAEGFFAPIQHEYTSQSIQVVSNVWDVIDSLIEMD